MTLKKTLVTVGILTGALVLGAGTGMRLSLISPFAPSQPSVTFRQVDFIDSLMVEDVQLWVMEALLICLKEGHPRDEESRQVLSRGLQLHEKFLRALEQIHDPTPGATTQGSK